MQLRGHNIDHYCIRSFLKKGGMGEIYLAEDARLERYVAIKIIWTDASHYDDVDNAEEAIRLFMREAQTLAKFDHPHILPIYSAGEDSIEGMTFMYLIMPYHAEGSLADWLHLHLKRNVLSIWDIERIVNQAASALQYAHDLNIIHQDIKSSNFLIHGEAQYASKLELKLADFGIAKLMSTSSKSQNNRGTPLYMAPEQWMGNPVPATDQYALAVMAYELLTGYAPFNGLTKEQLWHQHSNVLPEPPSRYNPHIPSSLDSVILKALEKRPEKRFASVKAFADAFREALLTDKYIARTHDRVRESVSLSKLSTIEKTVPAPQPVYRPPSPVYRPPSNEPPDDNPSRRQHHWGRLLIICCVLVILAGSGWMFYLSQAKVTSTNPHSLSTTIPHTSVAKTITTGSITTNATNTAQVNDNNATATANAFGTATATANAVATSNAFGATQTAQVNATQTQTAFNNATGTAYAGTVTGTTTWNDSLQDNGLNHGWETYSYPDGSGCAFTGGQYHAVVSSTGSINTCFAKNSNFANFSCQVSMKIVQGNQGGLIFRANEGNGTYYYFHINSTSQYALDVYNTDINQRTLQSGVSPAILTGVGQTNVISVVAIGSAFTLFVNMQALATVQDNQYDPSNYGQGAIAVVAQTTGNYTDVSFSDLTVWQK